MTDQEAEFAKLSIGISPLLAMHNNARQALALKADDKFNGNACCVISVGDDIQYLVNSETHLLEGIKVASAGVSLAFGDYAATDGVQFPGTRTMKIDAQRITVDYKLTSTKTNSRIDGSIFYKDGKEPESKQKAAQGYSAKQIIGFLDKDGDDKISAEESKASPELSPNFGYVDTNKDGFIDLTEAEAMVEYTKKNNPQSQEEKADASKEKKVTATQIIASMDKNKDGKISNDEANEELKPFFAESDSNGDGFIDEKEAEKIAEFVSGNH